ncbi:MAG: enoyl-CoA hydratase/isomerase family protein [Phycisphaerales bacterium]|nr:enoyl-CoA hydratase/isomerase family protein [Phycisphaerales bacterium]
MIRVERRSQVAHLILDRPDKRNALTDDMLASLIEHAGALAQDDAVNCILLRGEGSVFCAGFDLIACRHDDQLLARLLTGLSKAIRAIRRAPQPVVVAAHGAAIAGGCALLGAGDIVITDQRAKLGYPVVSLGISPAVSAPTLAHLTGLGAARELLLNPSVISGAQATTLGLAHICADIPEDVAPKAQKLAEQLASKPPHALRATKRWLNEVDGSTADASFDAALNASLALVNSDEERRLLAQVWNRA